MIAAVLKGLGGGFYVISAAHVAFVAETSSTVTRSFYLGLMLVMLWVANTIAPLLNAVLLDKGKFAANFAVSIATWVVYILYLIFVLREKRPESSKPEHEGPDANDQSASTWTLRKLTRSVIDPVILLLRNSTLRWLSLADFMMTIALGAFGVLVPYCDRFFDMHAKEVRGNTLSP